MSGKPAQYPEFARLVSIMARLRAPGGCEWDRAQTRDDLKKHLIEEAYEVIDAIEARDDAMLREELGDLLLQVVFHAQISAEQGNFDMEDICRAINEKLVRRHPHVFGDAKAEDAGEALQNWEAMKNREKNGEGSIFSGVPKQLPALLKAFRVQQKAAQVGFDWDAIDQVEAKVGEEWREFNEALAGESKDRVREEMGDYLFALVNLCRFLDLDPEDTLQAANRKFMSRFQGVEREAQKRGLELHGMTLDEMDALWDKVKERERGTA